jgi:hypothetical protein
MLAGARRTARREMLKGERRVVLAPDGFSRGTAWRRARVVGRGRPNSCGAPRGFARDFAAASSWLV